MDLRRLPGAQRSEWSCTTLWILSRLIRRNFKSLHLAGIVTVLSLCLHTMLLFFPTIFQYFFFLLFIYLFLLLFGCSFSSFLLVVVIKAHSYFFKSAKTRLYHQYTRTQFNQEGKNKTKAVIELFRESHTKSVSPRRVTRAVCLNSKSPRRVSCRRVSSSYLIDGRSSTIREIPYATSRKIFRPMCTDLSFGFGIDFYIVALIIRAQTNANNQCLPFLLPPHISTN
jgi:hypothetical protein